MFQKAIDFSPILPDCFRSSWNFFVQPHREELISQPFVFEHAMEQPRFAVGQDVDIPLILEEVLIILSDCWIVSGAVERHRRSHLFPALFIVKQEKLLESFLSSCFLVCNE